MSKAKIQAKEPKVFGLAQDEQIAKWKTKYPMGISQLEGTDENGDVHVVYVRKPNLDDIGASAKYVEDDPVRAGEIMFNQCFIGGSDAVKDDPEMKMGVIQKIGTLFKIKEFSIKKL